MPIDSFTVLLFGLLIKLVLGALFVVFWLKNRAAPWFGWWSVSLLLGSVTSVLYMSARAGQPPQHRHRQCRADRVASPAAGRARAPSTGGRRCGARSWLPPLLWLGVCLVPEFMASVPYRIVLSSALIAPLLAMSAV